MGIKDALATRVLRRLLGRADGGWSSRKVTALVRGVLTPVLVALVATYLPDMAPEEAAAFVDPLVGASVAVAIAVLGMLGSYLDWRVRDDEDKDTRGGS